MINDKVLFFVNVIPPDYGGGFLRAFRMAERLYKKNKLSSILTFTKKDKYGTIKRNTSFDDKITFLRMNLFLPLQIFLVMYRHRKYFNKLYIVSVHWYTLIAALIAKILGKKVIIGVTLQGVDSPITQHKNLLINFYYKIKNWQFKLADKIIVNSPALVEECAISPTLTEKVTLIVNPINLAIYKPITENEKQNLRKLLNLPLDRKIILFVGGVIYRKGADKLHSYLGEILKIAPNSTLVICGSKHFEESSAILNQLFQSYNIKERDIVHFREEVPNVHEYMQCADLFIFPSLREGLPNVILEAMACGLPILSNKIDGITDFLLTEEFLVNNNEVLTFVQQTQNIFTNPEKYRSVIERNLKLIEREFSSEKLDSDFLNL